MELVVAMTLSIILGTMATMFFVNAMHVGTKSILTNYDTGDARLTLDSFVAPLQVAGWIDAAAQVDRFEEVTPTKVVFWANLGNKNTANSATGATTKVALWLDVPTGCPTCNGQMVQAVFNNGPTNQPTVRILAFDASKTSGQPIFQPFLKTGGFWAVTGNTCVGSSGPVPGLCYQLPSGYAGQAQGITDPCFGTVAGVCSGGTHNVVSGPLHASSAVNDNTHLDLIGRIDIKLTVTDPKSLVSMDYTSSETVNSGYRP